MNSLQSGTPSSQLSPQAYKNSSQNGTIQSTHNPNSSQLSINNYTDSNTLLIVDDSGSAVLGVSANSSNNTANQSIVASNSSNILLPVLIMGISAAMFVYFVYRFINKPRQSDAQNNE